MPTGTAILNAGMTVLRAAPPRAVPATQLLIANGFSCVCLFHNNFVSGNRKVVTSACLESEAPMSHKARPQEIHLASNTMELTREGRH